MTLYLTNVSVAVWILNKYVKMTFATSTYEEVRHVVGAHGVAGNHLINHAALSGG